MGKVYFLFGVHNHQPLGNFGFVFEKSFHNCYAPFVNTFIKYPQLKFNLHISGPVYNWISENQPKFFENLSTLIDRRQLEIISGGFYEPIFPLIPQKDIKAQLAKMNCCLEEKFQTKPQGAWIPERVWEPYLANMLSQANLRYTFLDDIHFKDAGISDKQITGYYLTEDSAKTIALFPINKLLRYKIPFSLASEAIKIIKSFRRDKDVLVTLFDDGEKFGFWPHTFDWVYNKKWLVKFLDLLAQDKDIETITASEALDKFRAQGIIYIPSTSYQEMQEWVMLPQTFSAYKKIKHTLAINPVLSKYDYLIRGGFFRNYCRKYPRLNFMHKRMLDLSNRIKDNPGANDFLMRAQCNCAYWHGVFGGFYLGHIRAEVYENIIKAEKKINGLKYHSLRRFDIDLDGYQENLVNTSNFMFTVSDRGARLLEFSIKEKNYNILNTITRRRENYHQAVKSNNPLKRKIFNVYDLLRHKDKGLEKYLIYDRYPKVALVDHLADKEITVDDFIAGCKYEPLAEDCYDYKNKVNQPQSTINYSYCSGPVSFTKEISLPSDNKINVLYNFINLPGNKQFATECNFFMQSPKSVIIGNDNKEYNIDPQILLKGVKNFWIKDYFKNLVFNFDCSISDLFIAPLYSISSSEGGFEKTYQQLMLLFVAKEKHNMFNLAWEVKNI